MKNRLRKNSKKDFNNKLVNTVWRYYEKENFKEDLLVLLKKKEVDL